MLPLIIFLNAIYYLAFVYQYQSNINLLKNNNAIKFENSTLNDFYVSNNNTHHRFLMQPRIYNI